MKQNPDDPSVRTLLVEIESERGQQKNTRASLKRKIESLVIPEVNVREASLVDVMDFLQKQGQTLSADKAPINFVWQVPEQAKTAKVTLSLHDVPLADALKYVTQSCGLRYRVDPHAIVIFQPVPAPPANSPSPHAKP
ncbi:MAG TPA: hypothetical protein VL171_01520 [Verrucomicrobiae bacterium]|nr:hypothetical protein [Verrucomicrobiae bacterium]